MSKSSPTRNRQGKATTTAKPSKAVANAYRNPHMRLSKDHPEEHRSWSQRQVDRLACSFGDDEAFCPSDPVIIWIERYQGRMAGRCAEHAPGSLPPPEVLPGIWTFVLMRGWTPDLAKQAREWVAAQRDARAHTQAVTAAE